MKKWLILLLAFSLNLATASEPNPFKIKSREIHQVKILNNGLASLEERLQMIDEAEESIDVEYFIYNTDKSGKLFTQALIQRALEGVKVRLLLDYFMIKSELSPFHAHELEKHGIEVKYFNTTSSVNMFSGQYRNHRKVLLIDGKVALTGGRNIGDEYFDLRADFNFLDRDIKITGPVVGSIQKTFNEVWESKASKKVQREPVPELTDMAYRTESGVDNERFQLDLKKWNDKVNKARNFIMIADKSLYGQVRSKGREYLSREYSGSCENVSFNSELPIIGKKNRTERVIKHDLAERIKNAKESIVFDSPYFIVDDLSAEALDSALAKKVKVKLLTNSLYSTDAIYVYAVFDSTIKKWLNKGIEPYIFNGEAPDNYSISSQEIASARFGVHAKSFVFDRKDVIIGTFNFDPRSSNFNTEMTVSCENNPELAQIVLNDIEERIGNSIHLDSNKKVDEVEFYNTSFMKKLTYYVLKVPSNIFDYLL